MKKTITLLALILLFTTSCSNQDTAKNVIEKINAGKTLDDKDYETAINYLNDAISTINKTLDEYEAGKISKSDVEQKFNEIDKNYPHAEQMIDCLKDAPASYKEKTQQIAEKLLEAGMRRYTLDQKSPTTEPEPDKNE